MIRDDGLKKKTKKVGSIGGKYDPCQDGDFLGLPVFSLGLLKKIKRMK